MMLEEQPQYFIDRKTDLIACDRMPSRLANLNVYRAKEETQMNEVGKV